MFNEVDELREILEIAGREEWPSDGEQKAALDRLPARLQRLASHLELKGTVSDEMLLLVQGEARVAMLTFFLGVLYSTVKKQ